MIIVLGFTWGMSTQGPPGSGKSTGQLVTFSLVGLSGMLGTAVATQLGLGVLLTALAALGVTLPLAFMLLVIQNLFLKWAPEASDRIDRMLRRHRKRYMESLHEHVRHLEVLGVVTQGQFTLKLGDVYVDVGLTPKSSSGPQNVPLGQNAPLGRFNLGEGISRSESGTVAVVGKPGSGKTTLLRHQAISLCDGKRGRLPILVELRQHTEEIISNPRLTLADLAVSVGWLSGRTPAAWLEGRLRNRKCQVMLDGLDEVADPKKRRAVVEWLRSQISRYPGNKFVITSRPNGYDDNPLANADRLQVRDFTEDQISRFLHTWYEAVERRSTDEDGPHVTAQAARKAEDLFHRLRNHRALLDFAANPLLLTMIALVHRYCGALPGTRAELYREMCSVLLHRRRERKGLTDELTGDQKETLVRRLAHHMMCEGLRDISATDGARVVAPFLRRMTAKISAQDWLGETVHSGLLIEPREGFFAFSHLTLQEYLTAAAIKDYGKPTEILSRLSNSWWRETVLLWSSGSDVTDLVLACLDEGTVAAAVLATECMEVGREVEPETRDHFLEVIRKQDGTLYQAFVLTSWLRRVQPLNNSSPLCHAAVPDVLLDLCFTPDTDRSAIDPLASTQYEPAIGTSRSIALQFPDLLTELLLDGRQYRLPTAAELSAPEAPKYGDRAVWIRGAGGAQLWCPPTVRHPFQITRNELVQMVTQDLKSLAKPSAWRGLLPDEPEPSYYDGLVTGLRVHSANHRGADLRLSQVLEKLASLAASSGSQPFDRRVIVEARVLSLDCLDRLHRGGFQADFFLSDEIERVFTHTLCALAVHELRANGTITPNEILVLARE